MKIRQADTQDALLLSSLSVDVQRLHAQNYPYIFKMPESDDFAAAYFDEQLADHNTGIFIAEEKDQALGCVVCRLMERDGNPFTFELRYLLINQISVRPAAQGRGVGKALIKQVEVLAAEWNLSRIQLDSWGFNTSAHTFFEKMGFEKFNHRFWKNL